MMFDTSKSGGCTERVNYLKRGFLFYMCASCMLLAQFAIYLVNSNYWESLNFVGGFYYLIRNRLQTVQLLWSSRR